MKKFLLSMMVLIFVFIGLASTNVVKATSAGPIYLGITDLRKSGYAYRGKGVDDKKIWKIAQYDSATDTTADQSKLIYCIKGGAGFGSVDSTTAIRTYSQKFNLKNKSEITSPYINVLPTDANYNKLMWLLDNIYTGIGSDSSNSREAYFTKLFSKEKANWDEFYELLTDDDIDVIQQIAIWYYTNPDSTDAFHYDNIELAINSICNDKNSAYKVFEDLFTTEYLNSGDTEGESRQLAAKALYSYLITQANNNSTYTSATTESKPIELIKTSATMQTIGNNYVAGPYKITDNGLGVNYSITAQYKEYNTNNSITPTLGVKNNSGNIVSTNQTLKELVGTEFYLMVPTSSNIAGIEMTINSSYTSRTATYWSVENCPATEQPVVIVDETPHNFSDSASLIVTIEKPFDLALRKFITEVNGVAVSTSREPQVIATALINGTSTTATYNHTKDPIRVAVGDIVTYTIRVYNEGEVDGYVEEITDHLPDQLEFIADDQTNINYGWRLSSATDIKTVKTNYLSKANETTTGENKIAAFDKAILKYKDVKIKCKVVSTNPMPSKITNIADITAFTDGDGKTVIDRDSQENNISLPTGTELENYKDSEIKRGEDYIPGQQDDDDFEKLILKEFDLSLRKFITNVNGVDITTRIPQVDTTALKNGTSTTATYNHTKDPIRVAIGDTVTYTIRVYNEGEIDGYVTEITDHLPDQLEFVADNAINTQYNWTVDSTNSKIIKTTYLSKASETTSGNNKISAYDGGANLNYKDVKVVCKVLNTNPMPEKITNIADITGFTDANGNTIKDRDSQENNVNMPTDLPGYKDDEISKDYVPGQQDDDDFEKLMIKQFDLSLRKFITAINDTDITSRIPQVDTTALKNGTSTTATYNHTKEALSVKIGDIITYTIRVYNEGEIDGYVTEITDHLPDQLEFVTDNETNTQYNWTVDSTNSKIIKTTFLSTGENNKIAAFDGVRLSYKDVKVACKVVSTDPMPEKITNIADITGFTDANGNTIKDRDSQENNVNIPTDLPGYKDDEISKDYVPGQQDDDDFEKVGIKEFDLSLRKFITNVNKTDIDTRIPDVDITNLKNGTSTTAEYNHTKEPVLVTNGSIVTYTIRVYNEGEISGYAQSVKDDIPEGLEYLPDNETNKEYKWKMIDKDGDETEDSSKAVSIITSYLSKENEATAKENLIKAFDGTTLSYKDVKVAFKVIESNKSDRIIINQAQVADDSDEDGHDVDDRDSTPDEWNDGEDDQDIEKLKVQYFDLSLRKWVTQAIVIENGESTVTETGHTAEDEPEGVVKVDLKKKKIDSVVVKFKYKIRVKNEGQIPGYVKEIKDYIPDGLKFIQEDNPLWKKVEENIITTDQCKDVLLQPGETTEVEVLLTWINDSDNMGKKVNVAEISKDYNEFEAPDIDSTPDNKKEGEDDIDDAPVLLSIQTGEAQKYIIISSGVLIILATGVILIKKYVM